MRYDDNFLGSMGWVFENVLGEEVQCIWDRVHFCASLCSFGVEKSLLTNFVPLYFHFQNIILFLIGGKKKINCTAF